MYRVKASSVGLLGDILCFQFRDRVTGVYRGYIGFRLSGSAHMGICYIYIYMYLYLCVYIYIYLFIYRCTYLYICRRRHNVWFRVREPIMVGNMHMCMGTWGLDMCRGLYGDYGF